MKRAAFLLAALLCVATARAGVVVTDDTGQRVRLDAPARRIVSLAPHITETLYAAGAGDHVIATVSHSDHPEAAKDLPRIGRYDRFDVERILSLEPDVVIAWQSGNPSGQLQRLRELGVTLYISEPRNLATIARSLERYGRMAATTGTAARAAAAYRQRLRKLRARYADRTPIDVFYEVWNEPLMTVNGEHLISDVIRGCGGRNVFADLSALAPRIATEAVLERDPAVIVASGMDQERPEWLDDWKQWPGVRAVQRGNLFFIPPQFLQRHTPRILTGMQRLCEQLERAR